MTATTASSAKPYLKIQGLVKKFGDNYAVDNIDLDIYQHEIFALLGSSGSGKSTLLRMLAGMESPNQGKIILDGQDITKLAPYDRPINMMFQSYALFPHMTVEQNIAFGLKQDKMPKDEIAARVEEMLRLVQMTKYAKKTAPIVRRSAAAHCFGTQSGKTSENPAVGRTPRCVGQKIAPANPA